MNPQVKILPTSAPISVPEDELEPLVRVIIHNDDVTPMDFVVHVLRVFSSSAHRARWILCTPPTCFYSQFKKALARSDQLALEQQFIYANLHVAEVAYTTFELPMETFMLAMMLEMHKEVIRLLSSSRRSINYHPLLVV